MSKSMYCPNCSAYIGDCGHVSGGFSGPTTLSGTCANCENEFSVTCNGDCLPRCYICGATDYLETCSICGNLCCSSDRSEFNKQVCKNCTP